MQTRNLLSIPLFRALFLAYLLSLPTLLPVAAAQGQQDAPGPASAADATKLRAAEAKTLRLATLAERLPPAGGLQREALIQELRETALARSELLASLIEESPGEALRLALPERIRRGIPDEIQGLIEQRLELEGELTVYHIDGEDPNDSRYAHILETPFGERLSLHFSGNMPGLLSGMQVRARGLFFQDLETQDNEGGDGAVVLGTDDAAFETLACCDETGGSAGDTYEPVPNTFGEQRTLVLMVNFRTSPDYRPWSKEDVRSLVLGAVSDFFFENSYDQTWLAGNVHGWFTMDIDPTCIGSDIASAAGIVAQTHGVDLSSYERIVYVYPTVLGCGFSGKATVGGNPSRAWINGRLTFAVVGHEMGHNLGLLHSHALECGEETIASDCSSIEYGDAFDMMGNVSTGHFNAFQKRRLGWLDYGQSPTIRSIEIDSIESLGPYEIAGSEALALRVLRNQDPATGEKSWFYLEHRQNVGFDDRLAPNGVLLRTGSDADSNSSFLLDPTPNSSGTLSEWFDAAIDPGSFFTDPETGITVSVDAVDDLGATVSVSYGQPVCVKADPLVTISPSESQWVAAGTPVPFAVSVSNGDDSACGPSTFDLLAAVPAGWTANIAETPVTLDPGASGSMTVEVISDSAAVEGYYDVVVTAENSSGFMDTATGTYVVGATESNQAPVANNDSAETSGDIPVDVNVLANDIDPDQDALVVVGVTQGTKGTVTIMPEGLVHYQPNGKSKSDDGFYYTVSDGLASSTAFVTISIRKGKSGSGDNGKGNGNS